MHVVLFLGGARASTPWSLPSDVVVSSRPHKYICWNRGITPGHKPVPHGRDLAVMWGGPCALVA